MGFAMLGFAGLQMPRGSQSGAAPPLVAPSFRALIKKQAAYRRERFGL